MQTMCKTLERKKKPNIKFLFWVENKILEKFVMTKWGFIEKHPPFGVNMSQCKISLVETNISGIRVHFVLPSGGDVLTQEMRHISQSGMFYEIRCYSKWCFSIDPFSGEHQHEVAVEVKDLSLGNHR